MAAHVPLPPGLPQLLKEGTKHFPSQADSLVSNIAACKALVQCLASSYGPLGRSKLVIDHLGKTVCTARAGTVLGALVLENPAACLLAAACRAQEEELGDGTGAVALLAGALLARGETLLRAGVPVAAIRAGYERAGKEALRLLPSLVCHALPDPRDVPAVARALRVAVGTHAMGYQDFLATLVAQCCASVLPAAGTFDLNAVSICKVLGGGVGDSHVVPGVVLVAEAEGRVQRVEGARVAVYGCPFGLAAPAATNTALFQAAGDLQAYRPGEEALAEGRVRAVASAGAQVVVAGGHVDALLLHFADRMGIMVVTLGSRQALRQLCRALGAQLLGTPRPPLPAELGHCRSITVGEIGGTNTVAFHPSTATSPVATIILRGATKEALAAAEEAVRDGLRVFRALTEDPRLVPGAGATEMVLAMQLAALAPRDPGLEQFSLAAFAEALKVLPATLAENAGLPVATAMSQLETWHGQGVARAGLRLEGGDEGEEAWVQDATQAGVLDAYVVKHRALELGTQVAVTLLGVDEIFMAKKSGGPRVLGDNPNWDVEPDALE